MSDQPWGDIPAWVSAIATVLALAAAVVAGAIAYRVYVFESRNDARAEEDRRLAAEDRRIAAEDRQRAEADRRRAEQDRLAGEEDSRRAQAMKVASWYAVHTEVMTIMGAHIRNASDLPIFDVRALFFWVTEQPNAPWMPNLRGDSDLKRVIPPDTTGFIPMPESISRQAPTAGPNAYVVGIEFRDAAGNRWQRDAHGALIDLALDPAE